MAIIARRVAGTRRRMLSDINVVPYIDVMLVLVVILMIAAPFVNPSLVELPSMGKASRAPDRPPASRRPPRGLRAPPPQGHGLGAR